MTVGTGTGTGTSISLSRGVEARHCPVSVISEDAPNVELKRGSRPIPEATRTPFCSVLQRLATEAGSCLCERLRQFRDVEFERDKRDLRFGPRAKAPAGHDDEPLTAETTCHTATNSSARLQL